MCLPERAALAVLTSTTDAVGGGLATAARAPPDSVAAAAAASLFVAFCCDFLQLRTRPEAAIIGAARYRVLSAVRSRDETHLLRLRRRSERAPTCTCKHE
jgi:hypothetical protein